MQKLLNHSINAYPGSKFPGNQKRLPSDLFKKETALQEINNYLKSPDEMEAEFHLLAHGETPSPLQDSVAETPREKELLLVVNAYALNFPDFMEENY